MRGGVRDGEPRGVPLPTVPEGAEHFAAESGIPKGESMKHERRLPPLPMRGILPIGTRVLMMSGHPWAGRSGEIVRWEVIGLFAHEGPKPVIRLDDGHECFAMRPQDFGVIRNP